MESILDNLGTRVRKITCKVHKHDGKRVWTVSLYGARSEIDGRVVAAPDEKYTGDTLEEALKRIPTHITFGQKLKTLN